MAASGLQDILLSLLNMQSLELSFCKSQEHERGIVSKWGFFVVLVLVLAFGNYLGVSFGKTIFE